MQRLSDPRRSRGVSLNDAEYAQFRKLGGSRWLQQTLREMKPNPATRPQPRRRTTP
jgi:hypothetical protein